MASSGNSLALALSFGGAQPASDGAGDAAAVSVESARFVPAPIDASVSPGSVGVGVDCGMPDMCGLDPCLCGAADSWGACACNGMEDVAAQVAYESSNPAVATVEVAFGRAWVVPHGKGDATITAVAEMPHYEAAQAQMDVHVDGLSGLDFMAGAGVVLAFALVAGVAIAAMRRKGKKGERNA